MPKCQHLSVRINVEYVKHFEASSLADIEPPITHCLPELYGALPPTNGYWGRAHIYAKCNDCGHYDGWTSVDWRQFPKWFQSHWLRLVSAGGLPAEITRHYHMFEEAPASSGGGA